MAINFDNLKSRMAKGAIAAAIGSNPSTGAELPSPIQTIAIESRLGQQTVVVECSLAALIDGSSRSFSTARAKFDALVDEWEDHNIGRSITDYNHVAYTQIVGMGKIAIPMLLEKLTDGDGDWIYALKCISGHEAETPEMRGDPDRVIEAWLQWGTSYGNVESER